MNSNFKLKTSFQTSSKRPKKLMDWIGLDKYERRGGSSDFRLPSFDFRFPISNFRFTYFFFLIPTSTFHLLISNSERLKYFNFISCGSLRALLTQERFNLTSNWLHLFNIHWISHYPADNAIAFSYYLSAG